jgi:XTP/dITP diphosphohydrolase
MYRRNPHVFGPPTDDHPTDAAAVNEVWQAIKERDKPRTSPTDGLPDTLPALLYAAKVLERGGTAPAEPEELGDRLLALVAEAVGEGIDPEQALREAVRRRG